MYLFLKFLFVLLYLSAAVTETVRGASISSSIPVYSYNDQNYIFYEREATWFEAGIICLASPERHLLMITDDDENEFLAFALSDIESNLGNLWIGASKRNCYSASGRRRTRPNDCYTWNDGTFIDDKYLIKRNEEDVVPGRNCLTFSRNNHHEPLYVNLNCGLRRPFICVEPQFGLPGQQNADWVSLGDYEYASFCGKLSWYDAISACYEHEGAHIADFRNIDQVMAVEKLMKYGHPPMLEAWIGVYRTNDQWYYITNNEMLPKNTNEMTGYPPWYNGSAEFYNYECITLRLDPENDKLITFYPRECNAKRSYICIRKTIKKPIIQSVMMRNKILTLFTEKKTWKEANSACAEKGSRLIEATKDKISCLLYLMGETNTEIDNVWIGGRQNKKWFWTHSNEPINVTVQPIFNNYAPWQNITFDDEEDLACLNLTRENHNQEILYGTHCNFMQSFVCEMDYTYNSSILNSSGQREPLSMIPSCSL